MAIQNGQNGDVQSCAQPLTRRIVAVRQPFEDGSASSADDYLPLAVALPLTEDIWTVHSPTELSASPLLPVSRPNMGCEIGSVVKSYVAAMQTPHRLLPGGGILHDTHGIYGHVRGHGECKGHEAARLCEE